MLAMVRRLSSLFDFMSKRSWVIATDSLDDLAEKENACCFKEMREMVRFRFKSVFFFI
jgi:hypothetical protein